MEKYYINNTPYVAKLLHDLREEEYLSQKSLGNIIGSSKSVISKIENCITKTIDYDLLRNWLLECQATEEIVNFFFSLRTIRE